MFCSNFHSQRPSRPECGRVRCSRSSTISICAAPARAVITDTDWSLKISERELAFRPATDMMAMKTLMWDLAR